MKTLLLALLFASISFSQSYVTRRMAFKSPILNAYGGDSWVITDDSVFHETGDTVTLSTLKGAYASLHSKSTRGWGFYILEGTTSGSADSCSVKIKFDFLSIKKNALSRDRVFGDTLYPLDTAWTVPAGTGTFSKSLILPFADAIAVTIEPIANNTGPAKRLPGGLTSNCILSDLELIGF